jgi:23S rRNA (uracil1939-C5)-methyltransferase
VIALVAGAVRARALRDEATGGALAPCGPGSTGSLRAIDLREVRPPDGSPPRVLLTLVVDRSREFKLEAARDAARELADEIPAILGVGVNFHDGEHAHVLGSETIRVVGEGSALDRSGMATQRAGFGAFTQAHRGQAEAMHDLVFETFSAGATPGAPLRVLDLYGGSGAFAIGLASRFARAATGGSPGVDVVMVESFAPAAEAARADAARQGLPVTVLASDATKALESLSRRRQGFQAAVVNPPRRGVPPAARLGLARLAPAVVAYVSCDPDTLARDLDHLARLGLRAEEIHPFDMIPLSEHVEAVAILRGHEPPPPRELYADADVVAFDKPPHEPTTPQGEHVGSLTDRVRRCIGPEAVPIHRLDVGTSGVVFFARTPSRVAPFSRALGAASARKVYLVATRGVPPENGRVEAPIRDGGRSLPATTEYTRISMLGAHALLEVRPEQGRTHQIRIHMKSIGHPVLGDARYGHAPTNRHLEEKHGLDRTFLHCARIELVHPGTGSRVVVRAPLAGDLSVVRERLEGTPP